MSKHKVKRVIKLPLEASIIAAKILPLKRRCQLMTVTLFGVLLSAVTVGVVENASAAKNNNSVINPAQNALYSQECGDCHIPYSAGLLTAASWSKIMLNLQNHFGEDAELEPQLEQDIMGYLVQNAADRSVFLLSKKFARAERGRSAVDQITAMSYFLDKHEEVPAKQVTGNIDVGSFSRCEACHDKAGQGYFSEETVNIPNGGKWD